MPRELIRLNRVPFVTFVITLQKSQANILQNVTEKGYERSIKEDTITKNVPGKQICVPFCLFGFGTGYKNHHFSLEQNWAEAPIVESIDRLSIERWEDSPHTSDTTVQDHASTLLLLKMSRYSYQVKLHLHSIHNFFVCYSENAWNYLKSKLLGNESVLNEVHKRFVLHRPQYSTMTYYVTQQLYWIVMNIAKFSAHTLLTGRKSFLISVFNFKTCKTKRQGSLLCMTWHSAYPILVMYTVGTGAIITFFRMFLSNKIILGINLCEAMGNFWTVHLGQGQTSNFS